MTVNQATSDASAYLGTFFSGDRKGWVLRKETYKRRGLLRRRLWKCQLWVNADIDRWIVLEIAPRYRTVAARTGDGIDNIWLGNPDED